MCTEMSLVGVVFHAITWTIVIILMVLMAASAVGSSGDDDE